MKIENQANANRLVFCIILIILYNPELIYLVIYLEWLFYTANIKAVDYLISS